MSNLDLTVGKYPIIIKPNLGQPILLNLRDYQDTNGRFIKKMDFEVNIMAILNKPPNLVLNFFL